MIARTELENDQKAVVEAQIKLAQTQSALEELLNLVGQDISKIADLDLNDASMIQALFEHDEIIKVKAPVEGVLLKPQYDDKPKRLNQGVSVKTGQALYAIVNDGRYQLEIKVSESDVVNLAQGFKVSITPTAYPDITLDGQITKIGVYEAEQVNVNSDVKFPITIASAEVGPELRGKLYIGMTAEIHVAGPDQQAILVPIRAIEVVDDQTVVQVIDQNSGLPQAQEVVTGKAYQDRVQILSGIQVGDMIVVPH